MTGYPEFRITTQTDVTLDEPSVQVYGKHTHFVAKDHLYTVIAQSPQSLPSHIPSPNALHFSDSSHRSVRHLKEFNWIHCAHPFLPLVPQWNIFKGPLFSCLDYKNDCFPYHRVGRTFAMPSHVVKAWDQLEKHLRKLVIAMLDEGSPDTSLVSPIMSLWSYPASYGYTHAHQLVAALQAAAESSRDAFLPLIAAGTLGLMWMKRRERLHVDYSWHERLQGNNQIHLEWFSAFERSYANDRLVLRAGGILEAAQTTTPLLLSFYRQLNVPICIHWGGTSDEATMKGAYNETGTSIWKDDMWAQYHHRFESLRDVFPSTDEFWKLYRDQSDELRSREDVVPPEPSSSTLHPPYAPYQSYYNKPNSDSPVVEINSGQRPGESWPEFFARRSKRNLQRLALETPGQHQAREAREREAAKFLQPGRKGAVCWYWEERSGFRIRSCLTQGQVESEWERRSDAQKKYDGFSNTWDLCSKFGEFDPESDGEDEQDSDPHQEFNAGNMVESTEHEEQDSNNAAEETREDLEGGEIVLDTEISSGEALDTIGGYKDSKEDGYDPSFVPMTLEDVAYERYGFCGYEWESANIALVDLDTTRRLLGNGRWQSNPLNALFSEDDPRASVLGKLQQFFHLLLQLEAPSLSLPSHDLSDPSSYICDPRNWAITVIPITIDGEVWYIVRENSNLPPNMVLLVKCPVSVLQIVRCNWGPELLVIASQLVVYGIRFHTLIRGSLPSQCQLTRHQEHFHCYLSFRKAGYQPDIHDWRAYERERDQFLHSDRGRAAVLAGGLLLRMASKIVPEENVVFGGDPVHLQSQGRCFWEHEGAGYWDDFLTTVETDMLCGVYMVEKDQVNPNPSKASHLSWWPRPTPFQAGGLNLDYWSKDSEKWYLNRLRECSSRQSSLINASKWRKAVSFTYVVAKIHDKNRQLAAHFLQRFR